MKNILLSFAVLGISLFSACDSDNERIMYNGRLDNELIRIAAKSAGNIDSLQIEEGESVKKGQKLVVIDTDKAQAQLRRQKAQMEELNVNLITLNAQINQVKAQMKLAKETLAKTEKMLTEGAATEQQRDELQTQVEVYKAQLQALESNHRLIASKKAQIEAAMDLTRLNIADAKMSSPINGVVINKYFEADEFVTPGRVILEISDLSEMEATIYVPLTDLGNLKLNQQADVFIDSREAPFQGRIRWIASEAEFTPKTILTKETRTTLVYAVRLAVENEEDMLKIGMPVDVAF